MKDEILTTIGRTDKISLVELGLTGVPAKIDTGADSSSIWVSQIKETPNGLYIVFFGPGSQFYTGESVLIKRDYKTIKIANSFGHKELRYKVKLLIKVKGRLVRASFTLANRSQKTYPILLGRKLLAGKFVVNVSLKEKEF